MLASKITKGILVRVNGTFKEVNAIYEGEATGFGGRFFVFKVKGDEHEYIVSYELDIEALTEVQIYI